MKKIRSITNNFNSTAEIFKEQKEKIKEGNSQLRSDLDLYLVQTMILHSSSLYYNLYAS